MKEVTVTSSGDKTYLDVNAVLTTGDIEIGAVELKDGTSDARAPISATNGVLVNLGDNNDVTVTGSVTANAGTNLNTSALSTSANQGKFNGAVSGLSTWKEADGKPRYSSTPYGFDVSEGNITGHSTWHKIGFTGTMTTADSDIWSGAGSYPALLTTGIQMSIKSTDNTNDNAGGNGALKVTIYYLKTDFSEATEEVTMTGTSWVDTVSQDIMRINGFRVTTAGSTGKAAGTITLADKATRVIIYGNITLGYTRARNSVYTVPLSKTLYIRSFHAGFGANAANKQEYCRLYLRIEMNEGVKTTGIFYPYAEVMVGNNTAMVDMEFPIKVPQNTAIKISGIASGAGQAVSDCRGWLE
jgi:hypothetical protein